MLNINEYLDSTFLKTLLECNISKKDYLIKITSLIQEAIDNQFKLIMLRLPYIDLAKNMISNQNSTLLTGTVIDFPLGNSSTKQKINFTNDTIISDVDEIDCVADYESFKMGNIDKFIHDIYKVSELVLQKNKTIKWIIETGSLNNNQLEEVVFLIKNLVYDKFIDNISKIFIKTSTGYYKGTGANIKDIKLIIKIAGDIPIKASGGIYTRRDALEMINLGVKRIGTSKALDIFLNK